MGGTAVSPRAGSSTPVVHKHVQVREHVRSLLAGAEPGTPAPSERELVQQFKVARMTVRQALDALVAEGLLQRIPGRGTFVTDGRQETVPRLTGFGEEMRQRGMKPSAQTLVARLAAAGPGLARALGLADGDAVVHWRRLRLADDLPMCTEDAYLSAALVPDFLDTLPESLYGDLERRRLTPTWGEDSVDAALAQDTEAGLLEVPLGQPVLKVARRAFCDRTPVVVSRSVYRADRFTVWVPLTRVPLPR